MSAYSIMPGNNNIFFFPNNINGVTIWHIVAALILAYIQHEAVTLLAIIPIT
jgi:hypothetical protein